MKKTMRKGLSILLSMIMVINMATSAFAASYIDGDESKSYADGELDQAFADAENSVTLTSDETVNDTITVDKDGITLELNGNDIIKGDGAEPVFEVTGELTIDDNSEAQTGEIKGNENSSTAIIDVTNGGELTLEGGDITGNNNSNDAGGIYVNNGTVNINGGAVSENTASEGGGIYATNGSTVNINGGSIDHNTATDGSWVNGSDRPAGGGGVAVVGAGTLNMSDGVIDGNYAQGGGGGISLRKDDNAAWNDPKPELNITGGDITNNTAETREGGGIRLEGTGTIDPKDGDVNITGNVSNSSEDLGGGGLFLVNDNNMTIKNAIITGNEAGGLGGGLSACIHGDIDNLSPDGAVIYDNESNANLETDEYGDKDMVNGTNFIKDAKPKDGVADRSVSAHGYDKLPDEMMGREGIDDATLAEDIFIAGNASIGDYMPGGGSSNWTGFKADDNNNGVNETLNVTKNITVPENGFVKTTGVLGLTANPSAEDRANAGNFVGNRVLISGNKAKNHGGGIATNGLITFGTATQSNEDIFGTVETELTAHKSLLKLNMLTNQTTELALAGGEFTFGLKDANGNVVTTTTNDADGNIAIHIPPEALAGNHKTGEKQYSFTLYEVDGKIPGIRYDNSQFNIVITVKAAEGASETVEAVMGDSTHVHKITHVTYTITTVNVNGNPVAVNAPIATFTNYKEYTPAGTSVSIPFTKNITSAISGEFPENYTFKFDLYDKNDMTNVLQTVTLNQNNFPSGTAAASFSLNYTAADYGKAFEYTVVEQKMNESGWVYDEAQHDVKIEVSASGDDLVAAMTVADPIVFTNSYTPAPAAVVIGVQKNVQANGGSGLPGTLPTFLFELYKQEGIEDKLIETIEIEGSGTKNFTALNFTHADINETYNYKVVEKKGDAGNWSYDENEYPFTINIGADKGVVTATVTGIENNKVVFVNTYTPNPVSASVELEKVIKSAIAGVLPAKTEFTFELTDENGAVLQTVKIENSGKATFNLGSYGSTGEYKYKVCEAAGTDARWSYDTAVYDVVVTVTGANGILSADTAITKGGSAAQSIVFENIFTPDGTPNAIIKGTKKVSSYAPDSTFRFILKDEQGNELETVERTGAGEFQFKQLDYTAADYGKTFKYTVEEQRMNVSGWSYDSTVYNVEIEVTHDNDGTLEAVMKVEGDKDIVFVNTYTDDDDDEPYTPPTPPPVVPENPPVTPENPPEEIPDEPVPLDDEFEIPEEDVPLAELPDEEVPLVELPLVDVPKTGDSLMAYAMMGLSALGLAGLGLTKKEEDDE